MMKNSFFTLFMAALPYLFNLAASNKVHCPLAPALYCFGASVTESGNNNYLPTMVKANYPPYGIDFVGGTPTGRFTNGKTIVDFLAEKLGLPHAPPYLGLQGKRKPLTGVSYASGACGVLDETGQRLGMCLPLSKQVDYFQATVEDLKKHFTKVHFKKYLAKSIFTINVGTNDYINNYLQPALYNSSLLYTPQQFAHLLVDRFSLLLKRLYNLGARKFVVFDIPPTGCLPIVLKNLNSSETCVETVNRLIILYNSILQKMASNLGSQLKGSKFVLGATYNITLDMNLNRLKYGYEKQRKPCCDIALGLCMPGGKVCEDRDDFIYFDAVHWSERVHSYFAADCFDQSPSICTPFTVKKLTEL